MAGEDRRFEPAVATLDGETLVLEADGMEYPVAVRFAWHEEAEPNLVNDADLPASPFRTDPWPRH